MILGNGLGFGFSVEYEEVMVVEVLVIGGDIDFGCIMVEGFCNDGYKVILVGVCCGDFEVVVKEFDVDVVVCDIIDLISFIEVWGLFFCYLDIIVNVLVLFWDVGDLCVYLVFDMVNVWCNVFDVMVFLVVLMV